MHTAALSWPQLQGGRVTFTVTVSDETFYRDLRPFADFAGVCGEEHYATVPDSWDLVITDVEGSTKAIEAGRYKDVNAAGVSSIVVVRNAMSDIEIPYVFGGDGATLLTPSSRREQLFAALRGLRDSCKASLDLGMRVGVVPVAKLREAGHEIEAARFAASEHVCFAMLRGAGVDVGEQWVKDPTRAHEFQVSEEGTRDSSFEGFQCRWQPVPSRNGLVASIIVKALGSDPKQLREVYRRVVEEIATIVQASGDGHPVSPEALRLRKDNLDHEVALVAGGLDSPKAGEVRKKVRKQMRAARLLFSTGISAGGFNPRRYKRELVANTDFRKFDNVLRMHLDLRRGQLDRLKQVLQEAEDSGYLVYGIHTADHSLMTCVIDSYQGSHAHFVDGAAGGYALAAKRIKSVLKSQG